MADKPIIHVCVSDFDIWEQEQEMKKLKHRPLTLRALKELVLELDTPVGALRKKVQKVIDRVKYDERYEEKNE